ncbi:MAG: extracellular solute-binding protein [Alphaproteobacteria bacterium]|nr:extracellular solute-binding protein [Alphaproteobacteria bacterium]
MPMHAMTVALVLAMTGILLVPANAASAESVNLYSARKEALVRPLLDAFTEASGTEVRLVTAKGGQLHQRLLAEGENSPADVLLTVDAGNLWRAAEAGLLRAVNSAYLDATVPATYRDPDGRWYGLSLRARAVVYATERVSGTDLADHLDGYLELADPVWRGRVAVRSSNSIYNQSLIAAVIANYGPEVAERWAHGLVENFARPPSGGDRDQIRAVVSGEADLSIVNSYYYAVLLGSNEADWMAGTAIYFPADAQMGAHVNVSGAGVTRHAPHPDAALALIEFLASPEAQSLYAELNHEFPVHPDVAPSGVVAEWGSITTDDIPVVQFGRLNPDAVRIADRAGWN